MSFSVEYVFIYFIANSFLILTLLYILVSKLNASNSSDKIQIPARVLSQENGSIQDFSKIFTAIMNSPA